MTPIVANKPEPEFHDAQTDLAVYSQQVPVTHQASSGPETTIPIPTEDEPSHLAPVASAATGDRSSRESLLLQQDSHTSLGRSQSPGGTTTPAKERGISNLFSRSPTSDGERRESRIYNKLRKKKKRTSTTAANESAQSSSHSLTDA